MTQSELWKAVQTNNYPPGTTARHLAECHSNNPKDTTALHLAAYQGHLPAGTTIEDLVQCKTTTNWTALHEAADEGRLPPNITTDILKATKTIAGHSAWDTLMNYAKQFPYEVILELPPPLFKDNPTDATAIALAASKKFPDLKNRATIWLGHVLGAPHQL